MALLAGTCYDPGTAVSASTASLLAMTAFDTTNLRLTFTVPPNGCVQVRMRCAVTGATTVPQILLGVLQSSTVKGRSVAVCGQNTQVATTREVFEVFFPVTGLTAGSSLTWDAAYAVQVAVASTNIKYGGPNDTTTNNAWGGFVFEVWEAPNLLAAALYDPGTAANVSTASLLAMTAIDTTNLRLTFTAPASGNVLVRLRTVSSGSTTEGGPILGVLESTTIVAREAPTLSRNDVTGIGATGFLVIEAMVLITGLTPGSSHTYDAAYGVETATASTALRWGGPNDAVGADAWGAFQFEIWAA